MNRTYRVDSGDSSLHSEILYLDTGIGLDSPKLDLNHFSLQVSSALALEGGVWIKQYSDESGATKSAAGDVNISSRTFVVGSYEGKNVSTSSEVGIEVIPSFSTAFPRSTDGSSGLSGLGQTLGILANRTYGLLDISARLLPYLSPFVGTTLVKHPLGWVGELRTGAQVRKARAVVFLRGALDRDLTPAFVPGAERNMGLGLTGCNEYWKWQFKSVCGGIQLMTSLESSNTAVQFGINGAL